MSAYIIRRLLLLPLTLFAIILVNFVILNLAPGEPVNMASLSATGEASRSEKDQAETGDMQYLLFRQHYGLTLPILFNTWPLIGKEKIEEGLMTLQKSENIRVQDYHNLKILWADRSPYLMPSLLEIAQNKQNDHVKRRLAANLFVRGGIRSGYVGGSLSEKERLLNKEIAETNAFLSDLRISETDSKESLEQKINELTAWFEKKGGKEAFSWSFSQKTKLFFLETRFSRYLKRVMTLNFGTLRNDSNKTVISEVGKRIKYSLTLAVIPMLITFVLCQFFGMLMAICQNRFPDYFFNIFFLILFAIPVFVVAPFLIEKIAIHRTVPFTDIPIPYSGFHSPEQIYDQLTSKQRLFDVSLHLFLPMIAVIYGTLAVQSRLSRTAFLEVLKQDYIRTARAKGLKWKSILVKHVGRCGSITIVTSLAASLGIVLGGSLIIETLFELNGFGRFFYDAIVNRDYNVVLFSAFAGSFLTLVGYLFADIAYTVLDPRVTFE